MTFTKNLSLSLLVLFDEEEGPGELKPHSDQVRLALEDRSEAPDRLAIIFAGVGDQTEKEIDVVIVGMRDCYVAKERLRLIVAANRDEILRSVDRGR